MNVQAIIFFSKGLPSYAYCSLFQAHRSNPQSQIYLISDINPRLPFVIWENLESYASTWQGFASSYIHLNTCAEWLTRIWFYRWFAVRELTRKYNLPNSIHLDTDVLLLSNLQHINFTFPKDHLAIGSALGGPSSGHFAILQSKETLTPFLSFCQNMYQDHQKLAQLEHFYSLQKKRAGGGGICDMYAFGWASGWRGQGEVFLPTFELNDPDNLGSAFDHFFSDSCSFSEKDYYQMESGRKITIWRNGWHFLNRRSQLIPASTIHFQGASKKHILKYMDYKPMLFKWHWMKSQARETLTKLSNTTSFYYRHGSRALVKRLSFKGKPF
jgi:hypothetical protein